MYTLKCKLLETQPQIRQKILQALVVKLQPVIKNIAINTDKFIKDNFRNQIQDDDIIVALQSHGRLYFEIGVPNIVARIRKITEVWIDNAIFVPNVVTYNKKGISGGFTFQMVKSDYSDVLNQARAVFKVGNEQNSILPWLQWLLMEGGKSVIIGYDFMNLPGRGRTGGGIMITNSTKGTWEVPISDGPEDNFVTRAVNHTVNMLPSFLEGQFNKLIA